MKKGILMEPYLKEDTGYTQIAFETNPYSYAAGPIRGVQKFAVICLTSLGSDPLNPKFGTNIPKLVRSTTSDKGALQTLVRKEINSAIDQFFKLQAEEVAQLTDADRITRITLEKVEVDRQNRVQIYVSFTTKEGNKVTIPLLGGSI